MSLPETSLRASHAGWSRHLTKDSRLSGLDSQELRAPFGQDPRLLIQRVSRRLPWRQAVWCVDLDLESLICGSRHVLLVPLCSHRPVPIELGLLHGLEAVVLHAPQRVQGRIRISRVLGDDV